MLQKAFFEWDGYKKTLFLKIKIVCLILSFLIGEKTSLEIYKLSHTEVSAWHGREIDIFTNEDGPAIEPGMF